MGCVGTEKKSKLIEELIAGGLGTNDVVNFVADQRAMRACKGDWVRDGAEDRETIKGHMMKKLMDSKGKEKETRDERTKERFKLEKLLRKKKIVYKRFIKKV